MAEIKLTKNELRAQQTRLGQLRRYLPTLQLKKAMLQSEVNEARITIRRYKEEFEQQRSRTEESSALLAESVGIPLDELARVQQVHRRWENIRLLLKLQPSQSPRKVQQVSNSFS